MSLIEKKEEITTALAKLASIAKEQAEDLLLIENISEATVKDICDSAQQLYENAVQLKSLLVLEEIKPEEISTTSPVIETENIADPEPTKDVIVEESENEPDEKIQEESLLGNVNIEALKEDMQAIMGHKLSLNDQLRSQQTSKDLQATIGLNEQFLFQNELFDGKREAYDDAISKLNSLSSLEEATSYLETAIKPNFNWEDKETTIETFMELVERRFE